MTSNSRYLYEHCAVAFLDVLGFQTKLQDFENEAIAYRASMGEQMDEESEADDNNGIVYYSEKAAEFIDIFQAAVRKLNTDNFSYYLFSDNICITAFNPSTNKPLVDLLLIIGELYYEFAQKGYFLRGGVDYGLFVNKSFIAMGTPLANAYKIESLKAVFPRIVLSETFVKQFEMYSSGIATDYESIFIDSLISNSCEIKYINIFTHILKIDDKEDFLTNYREHILANLVNTSSNEAVNLKFQWLAKEFNDFIESYTSTLAYLDENFEPTDGFIENIKRLKISWMRI